MSREVQLMLWKRPDNLWAVFRLTGEKLQLSDTMALFGTKEEALRVYGDGIVRVVE